MYDARLVILDDLPAIRALLGAACAFDPGAAEVAEEKVFGSDPDGTLPRSLGAFDDGELVGLVVTSRQWIRLLAVAPHARGRGIGSSFLALCNMAIGVEDDHPRARTMDQPGNYLAPGIAAANVDTIAWFERRGYTRVAENINLLVDARDNPRASAARAAELAERAAARGYDVRRASHLDRASLTAAVILAFGRAWGFEVGRALDADPPAVHVASARATGELAAFAAHDGNNRGLGWFGPAGTFEPHRGAGLGEALLVACVADIAAAGHAQATIAWIGPRAFYERCVGVAGETRFVVLDKEL